MMKTRNVGELEEIARRLRRHVVRMVGRSQAGHPGGSLSAVDVVTALYFGVMNVRPDNPQWEDRDRFVLSKGHACPAVYAALGELGFFPTSAFTSFDHINSILQGHPDMRKTSGIDMSTGSLGQGLSVAVGMALGGKLKGSAWRVFTLLGDGELNEGQVWEAAMSAAKLKLDNLVAIVDRNKLQLIGPTEETMPLEPLAAKWRDFGWRVLETDGHDMAQLLAVLDEAQATQEGPTLIIAHTVKGRGVSYMENRVEWHSKAPTPEQLAQALKELGEGEEARNDG